MQPPSRPLTIQGHTRPYERGNMRMFMHTQNTRMEGQPPWRGGGGGGGVVSTCTPHHSQVTNWVHNLRRAGCGSPRRQHRATASEGRAHQKNRASLRGGRTRACTFEHNKPANNRSKCKWDRVHVPLWHSCILLHKRSATRAATCAATCPCSAFFRYTWRYTACRGPVHVV